MVSEKIVRDTLFIDMKYVILYHKLGFQERDPDIFVKNYGNHTITVDSEMQNYFYSGSTYPLLDHKDFVILECIDRLLQIGYNSDEICLERDIYDIVLKKDNTPQLYIICEQWGEDFQKCKPMFNPKDDLPYAIYTSRLSGGLIDVKSSIFYGNNKYSHGIFEDGCVPFSFNESTCWNYNQVLHYPPEFEVNNDILQKYVGNDVNVNIPYGIVKIDSGAFWNCTHISSVIIPDSVISIGGDAFVFSF